MIVQCINMLKRGLDALGICKFGRLYPGFLDVFGPTSKRLTVQVLLQILKPMFSGEGSNRAPQEKSVYGTFVKYVREAASGRRIGRYLKLCHWFQ